MFRFHSTISRRDFMKGLGLAGIGAATLTSPVFHDLDELISSGSSGGSSTYSRYPWWVKEVDQPTVDIDWQVFQKYDMRDSIKWVDTSKNAEYQQNQIQLNKQGILNKTPGNSLRDFALHVAIQSTMSQTITTVGTPEPSLSYLTVPGSRTRVDLGLPRWEGSPEENMRMCAAAIHLLGARDIGGIELDSHGSKVLYSYAGLGPPFKQVVMQDVDEAVSKTDMMIIPNKVKWSVVYSIPQSQLARFQNVIMGKFGVHGAYSDIGVLDKRVQTFFRGLGYQGCIEGNGYGNALGSNSGFGVLAGNGELGRHDYVNSPHFGALMRMSEFILTDLPIAPTKPVDAGMWRFCQACIKCAEQCPSGAISKEKTPTWEPLDLYNGGGRNCYPINYAKCGPWRAMPISSGHALEAGSGGCTNCQPACVFTKTPWASIHESVRPIVSTTSMFNSFFTAMDKNFDYGHPFVTPLGEVKVDPNSWWDRDLESYPFKGRIIGDGWA